MSSAPMYPLEPQEKGSDKELTLPGVPKNAKYCAIIGRLFKIHPTFDDIIFKILSSTAKREDIFIIMVAEEISDINRQLFSRLLNNSADAPNLIDKIRFVDYSRYVDVIMHAECILDTIPYGGCLTAHDAMSNGIPMVTLPLEHVRGRYAYGMYRQMEFLDLVANTTEQYADLAVRLLTYPTYRSKQSRIVLQNFGNRLHRNELVSAEWASFFKKFSAQPQYV